MCDAHICSLQVTCLAFETVSGHDSLNVWPLTWVRLGTWLVICAMYIYTVTHIQSASRVSGFWVRLGTWLVIYAIYIYTVCKPDMWLYMCILTLFSCKCVRQTCDSIRVYWLYMSVYVYARRLYTCILTLYVCICVRQTCDCKCVYQLYIHRKGSLYLLCRFSQLSIEIPGATRLNTISTRWQWNFIGGPHGFQY